MLIGTANIEQLASRAAVIENLHTEPQTLEQVEILQVTYEIDGAARADVLPPALHPTNPPLVTWLFYHCPSGSLGRFTLAQTRIECRSGVRPRGFLISSVIDNNDAGAALSARWGYAFQPGAVHVHRHYDAIRGTVAVNGHTVLDISALNPDPLAESDVQYIANMNLAHTPTGLRLVQVDPDYRVHRAERGQPRLTGFDAAAWGDARIQPVYAVSASIAVADITLPRIRFLCRPDVLAFEGTEVVR